MKYSGNIYFFDSFSISTYIKKMFNYASKYYVLMCPFWDSLDFYNTYKSELFDALSRGVHVFLICRSKDYSFICELLDVFNRPNLHIYVSDNFHAKLYFNDSAYLITSYNLSQSAGNDLGVMVLDNGCSNIRDYMLVFVSSVLEEEDSHEFISRMVVGIHGSNSFKERANQFSRFSEVDDDLLPY